MDVAPPQGGFVRAEILALNANIRATGTLFTKLSIKTNIALRFSSAYSIAGERIATNSAFTTTYGLLTNVGDAYACIAVLGWIASCDLSLARTGGIALVGMPPRSTRADELARWTNSGPACSRLTELVFTTNHGQRGA